jgi:hypothetical protein
MSFPSFLEHLRMFFSGVPGAQEAPQMSKIDIEVENDELPVPSSCERSYGSLWFYVLIHIPIMVVWFEDCFDPYSHNFP